MSDSDNEGSFDDSSISPQEKKEDSSKLTFGENTPSESQVISSNLQKKRTPTTTLLNETSKESELRHAGKARRTDNGTIWVDSPAHFSTLDQLDEELNEEVIIHPVEKSGPAGVVGKASDIDSTLDILPRSKIKATKEGLNVPEIVKLLGQEDVTKTLSENIFTMVSCLVCERITTCGLTLKEDDKLELYRKYYYEQLESMGLDSYLEDHLFCHVTNMFSRNSEGRLEWPAFYIDHIRQNYSDKGFTKTQLNRKPGVKELSAADAKDRYFSLAIKNASSEAKTEINNRLSRLWRDPLDSGESRSGVLDCIRETTRSRDAYLRGKLSVNNKWPQKNRHGDDYASAIAQKQEKLLSETTDNYFPSYWLTYEVFGPPAHDREKILKIFTLENIADLQEKMTIVDGGQLLNGNSRRTLKSRGGARANNKATPTFPTAAKDSPPLNRGGDSQRVHHTFDLTGANDSQNKSVPMDSNERILNSTIDVLIKAGRLSDGTYVHQEKISALTARLAEHMLTKLE
jgi:hypothetical protein